MPLLVVPVAPDECGRLTLDEWDALVECTRVVFEQDGHPLMERLRDAGVSVEVGGDARSETDKTAFVVDPRTDRIIELARSGAVVTSGVADSPDALSAAYAAPVVRRASSSLGGLAVIMARLRSDDGCPWDREQTHESLRVHLIEESYEVIDAIDRGELGAELAEELGDLLLQVVFHSRLAAQDGRFDIAGVADGISSKLLRRHPHVFGDTTVADAGEVVRNWETIKSQEKHRDDPFDDIPGSLPALLSASKVQKRAASTGFSIDENDSRARATDALGAAMDVDAVGEALFWTVAAARAAGVDPEGALRGAIRRFRDSVR